MKKILFSILALFAIATTAGAQNKINGHEYVDLGLPSGLLWATCNVGATEPEEYGDYFAWGETTTKENYSWDTYKWCKGSEKTLTKYCDNSDYGFEGFTDNLTTLLPEDDAAAANWKGGWRMPTVEDCQELLSNTDNEFTTLNGVNGCKFTAKNGNFIFLPFTNYEVDGPGRGYYWSSSLKHDGEPSYLRYLYISDGGARTNNGITSRSTKKSVRPVIEKPSGIAIDATNFPDANFRNVVADKKIDKDENGYLSDEEIAAVKTLVVANKKITDLKGIEFFAALETFSCYTNQLTSLNVSANKKLTKLDCSENKISITEMQVLVDGLPTVTGGLFYAIDTGSSNEGNVITKSQVNIAKGKGWIVYSWHNGSTPTEYEGSDDPTTDPKTLSVTFTKATTPASSLSDQDKAVLGAVVVLAQKGMLNGYSVEKDNRTGTITLKKGTKTLFVMDKDGNITVPSGVTSADNINVELTQALRQALGTGATQLASYDAIQIKFDINNTPTAIDNSQFTIDNSDGDWYSIDGKKLQGEPTKKGVYIIKGKKVVK